MTNIFIPRDQIEGHKAYVVGSDVDHLMRVLRLGPKDTVSVRDGQGHRYMGTIMGITTFGGEEALEVSLGEAERDESDPKVEITLFQGIAKGDKVDFVVQKATEIGVHAIQPVAMERCVVRLEAKKALQRQQRWQKIAVEAAKQSGRAKIPAVLPVVPLDEALTGWGSTDADLLLVPWEEATVSLRSVLTERPLLGRIGIVIGPEGGITRKEAGLLEQRSGKPVSLGPRILRTETAGMVALTACLYEFGELG